MSFIIVAYSVKFDTIDARYMIAVTNENSVLMNEAMAGVNFGALPTAEECKMETRPTSCNLTASDYGMCTYLYPY